MFKITEYGYENDATPNTALWDDTAERVMTQPHNGAWYLRSGRDAIKMVAAEHPNAVALLPALSCESMTIPFSLYGLEVRYYRLTERYAADVEHLRSLIVGNETELVFLYMDYFGNTAVDDVSLEQLQRQYPTMVFVEDRTHNLLQRAVRQFSPDYTVASLRKWTNIPDGGILWTKRALRNQTPGTDISFAKQRLRAQEMRHRFFETGDPALKQEYRSIFSTVTDQIDADPLPHGMSEYAFRLWQSTDCEAIAEQRRANAETLISMLRDEPIQFVQDEAGKSDLYVALLTERRDEIQRRLAAIGVFCTVIWPLDDGKRTSCPVAARTERCLLAAPCDQRYTQEDMRVIGKEIVRALHE